MLLRSCRAGGCERVVEPADSAPHRRNGPAANLIVRRPQQTTPGRDSCRRIVRRLFECFRALVRVAVEGEAHDSHEERAAFENQPRTRPMHTTIVVFILSIALIAVFDTASSSPPPPGSARDEYAPMAATECESRAGKAARDCVRMTHEAGTATPTAATECESLAGKAARDCVRMTHEAGTATPAQQTNAGETPATAAARGTTARAARGSGREASSSSGITTGTRLSSTGATTK